MQLYQHQKDAVDASLMAYTFDGIRRQLIQMPTGAGKSLFAAALAHAFLRPDQRFLYIAHQEEILDQSLGQFCEYFPAKNMGIVQGSRNTYFAQHIFATIQTIQNPNRLRPLLEQGPFSLIFLDECHRALAPSWKKVVGSVMTDDTLLVGMTATPMRSDRQSLRKVFDECVYSIGMLDLLALDLPLLCDLRRVRVVVPDLSLKHLKRGDDGDFDERELEREVLKSKVRHNLLVEAIHKYAHGLPGIVFCAGVADANAYAKVANAAGIPTAVITKDTTRDERRTIESAFGTDILCIANYAVYTEGKDLPQARFVGMLRHTTSQGVYVQCVGRGTRLLRGEAHRPVEQRTKRECIIFDVCDNDHSVLVLADMAGTTDERLGNRTIRQALKEKIVQPAIVPREIDYHPGNVNLRLTADSLFTTRPWRQIGSDQHQWVCRSKLGNVYVDRDYAGYTAYYVSPNGQKHHIKNVPTTIEHAFGAGELYLKKLEVQASYREEHKSDIAPPVRIAKLRAAKCPAKILARPLTNKQVDDLWANKKQYGWWWPKNTASQSAKRATTSKPNPRDRYVEVD